MKSTLQGTFIRYVVISPVRNEERYLEQTIQSMLQQTVRPVQWILVNDGSTDRTAEIIRVWASEQPWIVPVHSHSGPGTSAPPADAIPSEGRRTRGTRAQEAKEIEAFYEGYERSTYTDWDFLVKLDGDLSFAPDYFEKCFAEFAADPKLGIGGGVICHWINGKLQVEPTPRFHVRGATKIYRRACWDEITGVIRGAGWDTMDEVKANMLGWSTRSFTQLSVIHHRFTGSANGLWRNAVKNGMWSYISGYHPLFMILRCIRRSFERPYLLGSIGLLYGFLLGYLQRLPRISDDRTIRYLREQQLRRMLFSSTVWK